MDLDTLAKEVHDGVARGKFCVLGKLIADRMVSREIIKTTLMRWWKLSCNFSFTREKFVHGRIYKPR